MDIEKHQNIGMTVLRFGLGALFIGFAIMQFSNPSVWTGFVPDAVASVLDPRLLVLLNATIELVLGTLLILGVYTWIVAMVLAAHLFLIAISLGLSPTGLRDFGLAFATAALMLMNPKSRVHKKVVTLKPVVKATAVLGVFVLSGAVFAVSVAKSAPSSAGTVHEMNMDAVHEEEMGQEDMDHMAPEEQGDELDNREKEQEIVQDLIDEEGVAPHGHGEDFPNITAIERKADSILSRKETAGGGTEIAFIYHNTFYEATVNENGKTIEIHADEDGH